MLFKKAFAAIEVTALPLSSVAAIWTSSWRLPKSIFACLTAAWAIVLIALEETVALATLSVELPSVPINPKASSAKIESSCKLW